MNILSLICLVLALSIEEASSAGMNTVETMVYVDKQVVKRYKGFGYTAKGKAESVIRDEIKYYFQEMNAMYAGLKKYKLKLQLSITGIQFINNLVTGSDISNKINVNSSLLLKKFTSSNRAGSYDLAILYTGFDLTHETTGSTSNAGLANRGVVCNQQFNTAIIELHGTFTTVAVGAHEIGHTLGATHDTGSCQDGYNMNPGLVNDSPNRWSFSSCSATFFKNYIKGLKPNCMMSVDSQTKITGVPSNLDIQDPDTTCNRITNLGLGVCRQPLIDKNVCQQLSCSNLDHPLKIRCVSGLPAEGMPCQSTGVCRMGSCVGGTNLG